MELNEVQRPGPQDTLGRTLYGFSQGCQVDGRLRPRVEGAGRYSKKKAAEEEEMMDEDEGAQIEYCKSFGHGSKPLGHGSGIYGNGCNASGPSYYDRPVSGDASDQQREEQRQM